MALLCLLAASVGAGTGVAAGDAAVQPPARVIDAYFEELRGAFDKVTSAAVLRQVQLGVVDRYFVKALQTYPTMTVLLRTNSKGVLINEVIRGRSPARVYRAVGAQRWHRRVRSSWRASYTHVTDRTGRTFLFWAEPLIGRKASGAKRFMGAVAVKFDLAACLEAAAERTDVPMAVMVGGTGVYRREWSGAEDYVETAVTIPGVSGVVVRTRKRGGDEDPAGTESAVELSDRDGTAETAGADSTACEPRRKRPVAALVLGLVVLGGVGAFVRSRMRRYRILREVHRDDAV
jgi:hypothetical protein